MIDSMFQAGTDAALDDQVARPAPFKAPEPKFGMGQLAAAPFQGVASGSTKTAAFGAEVLGAFGDVAGAGGFNQGGMFSTPTQEERKQQEAARAKWIETGPQFSNPVGDELRQRAKDVMPDPTQTHAAAQIVAGVAEFATQAVGYAAGAGPLAPALLAGDVGMAEADKLKQQGVDLSTRTKAGAVAGVVAGASIALPVVGKTAASTAALVVAGGPGGFIGQNVAERAILQNAGYDKIASQYDPLDPVGLALSTLVPAAFGGVALRARTRAAAAAPTLKEVVLGIESNGQRYAKDGSVLTSPKGAKGEMQVMDGTNLDPGYGVRPAADNSLAERARVGSDYLDAMLKRYGSEDKAMAAYNAGPGALDAALAKGGDWLGRMPAETQAYVKKGMAKLGDGRTSEAARATIARDPDAVAAARVRQTADTLDSYRLTPDRDLAGMTRHQDAMETAHEQLARGESVDVSDLVGPQMRAAESDFSAWFAGSRVADDGAPRTVFHGTPAEFATFKPDADGRGVYYFTSDADLASRYASEHQPIGQRMSDIPESGPNVRPSYLALKNPLEVDGAGRNYLDVTTDAIRRAQEAGNDGVVVRNVVDQPNGAKGNPSDVYVAFTPDQIRSSFSDHPAALSSALAKAFEPPPAARVADAAVPAPKAAKPAGDPASSPAPKASEAEGVSPDAAALDARATEVAEANPDLMVQLEGMDKPMRASELLEQVKKEAADETRDASLVEVAANCFLGGA